MRTIWRTLAGWIETWSDALSEGQRELLRATIVVTLLGAIGGGVYHIGAPQWRQWRHDQALDQAKGFAERNDYHNLLLALRRATALEPGDPATWHEAEKYLAQLGSPEAIVAGEQIARLEPGNMAVRLALVQEALALGRVDKAAAALDSLEAGARRDVAFHRLAAAVALATGHEAELETQLAAILAALPNDPDARFNYAAVRLWSLEPATQATAQAELMALLDAPAYRIRASIMLLTETARQRDANKMAFLLEALLQRFAPGAKPDFASAGIPGWVALIQGMKTAAAGGAGDAALLARWLADTGAAHEAEGWLETLPPAIRSDAVVADAAAELSAEIGDLAKLDAELRAGAWGPIPDNARLLALASRVQRLSAAAERARGTWGDAVAASAGSVSTLRALARLAGLWGDPAGAELALEGLLARQPKTGWAFDALRNSYIARGDLAKLDQLYVRWLKQEPDDAELAAAWITLAATLNEDMPTAIARAEQLLAAYPSSRTLAIAVAALRWRQGRPSDAWQALAALTADDRRNPTVAFWSVLILADLGRVGEVKTALASVSIPDLAEVQRGLLKAATDKLGWAQN